MQQGKKSWIMWGRTPEINLYYLICMFIEDKLVNPIIESGIKK